MELLVVIEYCCPGRGSIDDGVHLTLSELAKRGVSVGLLTSDLCRYSGVRRRVEAGYPVWIARSLRLHADAVLPRDLGVVEATVSLSNVVVVHEPYQPLSLFVMEYALRYGRRVVIWCDRYYPVRFVAKPLLWYARYTVNRLQREGLFAGLACLTRDACEWCRETLRLPLSTPVYSAPIPYNPEITQRAMLLVSQMMKILEEDMFRGAIPDLVIGFIGRLTYSKGVDVLDRAVRLLAESGLRVKAFVGALPWGGVEYWPRAPGVVVVSGERIEKLALLVASTAYAPTVYVQPSRKEPFGIALLEAMSLGLPVVASNVAGPAEILGAGQYGLLAPPDNPKQLAQTILYALRYHDKLAQLAKQRAQHYTPRAVADKWENMLRKLA